MNLFADLTSNEVHCPTANFIANGFQPLTKNGDGLPNSCTNPAKYGSTVSFFMHGVGGESLGIPPPQRLFDLQAFAGFCSAAITNASLINDFVYRVDVSMPASLLPCAESYSETQAENQFPATFSYQGLPVVPLVVPTPGGGPTVAPGQPMPMIVWVTK